MIKLDETMEILKTQSTSRYEGWMHDLIMQILDKYEIDYWYDDLGNIYAVKGYADTYPCIVAHTDTVHDIIDTPDDKLDVIKKGDICIAYDWEAMQQTGIGGDDKCGIIAALECAINLPAVKLAFFVEEEIGCKGSGNASLEWFKDCRFILQADRRGNRDAVNNACWADICSDEFMDDIMAIVVEHGFKFAKGTVTDVQELSSQNVGISCINFSAGYYNPHTSTEYINLKDLANTISLMYNICLLEKVYPHTTEDYDDYFSYHKSYIDPFEEDETIKAAFPDYEPIGYKPFEYDFYDKIRRSNDQSF